VSMKKPADGPIAAFKQHAPVGASNGEPAKLVCAGLVLAVITLALRIMSVW
jgi:hypothetical protein